ncbi:MAG TPA: PP2C family protein-serine/threonine phosphatase [Ktedonobacteraceae bacterium]
MATFQITARVAQGPAPQRRKGRRLDPRWALAIRVFISLDLIAGIFVLLHIFVNTNYLFILLPVLLSMVTLGPRRYSLTLLFDSAPLYTLLSFLLSLFFYVFIVVADNFIHRLFSPSGIDPLILMATVLAWAVLLNPLRDYLQTRIEQRFNVRNREAHKAIVAFTATLREEIDLTQVCTRFLAVVQQTLNPYSVTLWVRSASQESAQDVMNYMVADDDPFVAYALSHPGTLELERLRMSSPLLQSLQDSAVEIVLALASQGELIGLLALGPRQVNATSRNVVRALFAFFLHYSLLHLILLLILGPQVNDEDIYTRQELETLSALGTQVAPALRVAQMVQEQQEQVRERERIEQELRTAQAIQKAFLPKETPALSGWHLMPYYQPAREVGGDFYDFIALEDGLLGLVIGDVTGKGVPAALVMATVLTMLRGAARASSSPAEVLELVNDLLAAEIPAGVFVTCFYALLDPRDGSLRYANAGHEAPYRQRENHASELWATGMPLGMLPGSRYEEFEATLAPGESLLFYSDGLIEAHNPSGEMFGFPRLQALLSAPAREPALLDFVLAQLYGFTGEKWEQEDDVTLLTLQRVGEGV